MSVGGLPGNVPEVLAFSNGRAGRIALTIKRLGDPSALVIIQIVQPRPPLL